MFASRVPSASCCKGGIYSAMGSGKRRRASGAPSTPLVGANSPLSTSTPGGTTRQSQHQDTLSSCKSESDDRGWAARVKVLASSTLGNADRDEGGRTIALTEEDFRKNGFKSRQLVVVLAGPTRLIAGRVSPCPSAALRPGSVGLASASVQSLGCDDGARVRVRRLEDTDVTVTHARLLWLLLERGPSAKLQAPHAYLESFSEGRKALLHRAAGYTARGCHLREGDLLTVSFEGVPHSFRVSTILPAWHPPSPAASTSISQKATMEAGGDESNNADVLASFAALSVSEPGSLSASISYAKKTLSSLREDTRSFHPRDSSQSTALPSPALVKDKPSDNVNDNNGTVLARLEAFYREHNRERLDSVPEIIKKYAGREDDLFAKLERKYGPGSLRAVTSGGDSSRQRVILSQSVEQESPSPAGKPQSRSNTPGGIGMSTPTPSKGRRPADHQGLATPVSGRVNSTSARAWGREESLWLISASTSIELSAVDTPPQPNNLRGPPEHGQKSKDTVGRIGAATTAIFGVGDEGQHWSAVGGLSSQIEQLKEAIQLPLNSPEVLRRYGVRPPRGVLLHGPPGTGKTTLARAAAAACGCHVIVVNGSELMSRFVGESEGALRQTFAEASRKAPCLIVFDEVDTLCPRRDEASSEAQRRVVSTMLALLDGVDDKEQVVVIACTNRPQAIDPALRRPGRLDSEVEVGVPDEAGRAEIVTALLRGVPHSMGDGHGAAGVKEIASRTHGFVGADLLLLVKEAALQALRRTRGGWGTFKENSNDRGETRNGAGVEKCSRDVAMVENSPQEEGNLPVLTLSDFRAALPLVSPSGLREVAVEVPSVKWDDIGGMHGVKQSLREVVEWPLRHPQAFQRMGMSPPRGVLLYGPPGCSKTLMARALATESGMNFLAVKGPELLSKWLGESERAMQGLFKRARLAAPTIIFFDEIDALACRRGGGEGGAGATERVLTQLLTELDGIQPLKRVVVVAATNRPDVIDPALLRPGRLDRLVYVPPPDTLSRREILRISLAKVPAADDVDREELAQKTNGFSGAEIVALCREASICALEENRSATEVRQKHLQEALEQMRPQITPAVLASYTRFNDDGL